MATMPVVAGVDGSAGSLLAVEWATLEARRHHAPLRIVSVPALLPRMRARDAAPQAVAGKLSGEPARALSDAVTRAEQVASRLAIDASLLEGPPALAVTLSGSGALMLVLGARGAGGVRGHAARLGQQVRGHACLLPGHRGPRGGERSAPLDRRRHPRPAGHDSNPGIRVR
jgi:nucleotide-binding universal stress UspA family protein